ncbi:acetolactate synthase small subunit [Buchnera aphidicola (Kurisakia onigurumii)]|uniref:acetolactate synthase small subunit n=1 Tax=Buchnera aphidicola TaxID=9 RepID=UPI0031B6D5AE
MKKILSILLENEFGSLSRVIGLFSQRGYNIDSISVSPTEDTTVSQVTIQTTVYNLSIIEQIKKQLKKLINVLKVTEINKSSYIETEIILIKIEFNKNNMNSISEINNKFFHNILYQEKNISIIQITGSSNIINKYLIQIKKVTKILEISRSGIIGLNLKK